MRVTLANAAVLGVIPMLVVACKPSDEPAFPWGEPPAGYPVPPASDPIVSKSPAEPEAVGLVPRSADPKAPSPEAPTPATESASPAPETPESPETPAPEAPQPAVESPEVPVPALPVLDPAIRAAIAEKVKRAQRLEARAINREGLKLHKKGEHPAAITKYRQALLVDPRSVYPRYNLACALALTAEPGGAIQQLLALRALGHDDKVADARVDADFATLRADPGFLELTGFARVALLRRPGVTSQAMNQLADIVKREARYEASARGQSPVPVKRATVFYRSGHDAAAGTIAGVLGVRSTADAPEVLKSVQADVIVVIAADAEVTVAAGKALERFYDRKLRGKSPRGEHMLKLKSSGFFTEVLESADGVTLKRSGTFEVKDGMLVRTYTERRETPDELSEPEERSDRVSFEVKGKSLVVDGLKLKP